MATIIPSINCPPGATGSVYDRLASAKRFGAPRVHLDLADGVFTFHKTWNEPGRWPAGKVPRAEVHLMVEDPRRAVADWERVDGVDRFIVHVESVTPAMFRVLAAALRRRSKSVMLAVAPETSPRALRPYLKDAIQFQILAVHPGLSGQKFLPRSLEKIAWLRRESPNAIIEVDGGITPEVAALARRAGADILISDHYIFDSPNPAKAYRELVEA